MGGFREGLKIGFNGMKKISLLMLTCFLCGCSLLGTEESRPLYTLKSKGLEASSIVIVPLSIAVPVSEASLNTARIAITPSPYQRDYLADGEWPDRLPKVLQEVFLEAFSQRWGATYVNRVGAGLSTHFVFQSEILDFSVYHLDQGNPEVRLKVIFKLMDFKHRRVLAAQTFTKTAPISQPTMKEIVASFNTGLHCLLKEAIGWMEETLLKESALNSGDNELGRESR